MGKSKEDLITELHFLADEYIKERWKKLPIESKRVVVGSPESVGLDAYKARKEHLFDLWRYQFFFERCVDLAERLDKAHRILGRS